MNISNNGRTASVIRIGCTICFVIVAAAISAEPVNGARRVIVGNASQPEIAEFDARTGALINPLFISLPRGGATDFALFGNNLLVASDGAVREYNAKTGAPVNLSFITQIPGGGGEPSLIVASGNSDGHGVPDAGSTFSLLALATACIAVLHGKITIATGTKSSFGSREAIPRPAI